MTIDNRHATAEPWDNYWETKKRMIDIDKITDFFVNLYFESGKFFIDYINKNQKKKFIELGCGGGTFLQYFYKKYENLEIFGIDISSKGVKATLKRLNGGIPSKNIICDDILKKQIQQIYDISFSFGLIEHFDDPSVALKKHVDILKKDGIMICVIPNLVGLHNKILKSKIWFTKKEFENKSKDWIFGCREISIDSLKRWSKYSGLKDIKILPIGGFLPLFLIETIRFNKKSKGRKIQILHRYCIFPFFILLNMPTLFRLNSFTFSPYIIIVGKKK